MLFKIRKNKTGKIKIIYSWNIITNLPYLTITFLSDHYITVKIIVNTKTVIKLLTMKFCRLIIYLKNKIICVQLVTFL